MSMIGHNGGPQEGYILIFRSLLNHPVVGMMQPVKSANPKKPSASRLEAWLDLLMMAVYDSKSVTVNGFKFDLERGDQACATSFLSKRWNWSQKTARGFLERLENHGMLQRKGRPKGQANGKRPNHLSICNYSQYQDGKQCIPQNKGKQEGKQRGKQEGKEDGQLTRCNKTINMFSDEPQGQPKGHAKGQAQGPQYKTNYNQTKPNNKLANSESSNTLNGSTNEVVSSLAEWSFEAQYPYEAATGQRPPEMFFKEAGRTLNSMVASCGARAVMRAHSDMMVKKMNNELVGNRLKLFAKIAGDYRTKIQSERKRQKVVRG